MTGCAMLELPSKLEGGDDRILRAAAPDTHLRHRLRRDRQQYRLHPLARGPPPRAVGPGLPADPGAGRGCRSDPLGNPHLLSEASDDRRPAARAHAGRRAEPGALAARRRIHRQRRPPCRGRAGRVVHAPVDAPADRNTRADSAPALRMTPPPPPMALALAEAEAAAARGEVPVGAVLI